MSKATRVSPPVSKPIPPRTTLPVAAQPFDPALLHANFRNPEWWKGEAPRFLRYAAAQIHRRMWRGNFGDLPPGAMEPSDYVQTAAQLVISGERQLPTGVKTIPFVIMVIRSLISHEFDRPENRRNHSYFTSVPEAETGATIDETSLTDTAPGAHDVFAAHELLVEFMRTLPLEYKVYVDMLVSGMYPTAADRAKALGASVAKIRLMDRVIRRLRSTWKGTPPQNKVAASE